MQDINAVVLADRSATFDAEDVVVKSFKVDVFLSKRAGLEFEEAVALDVAAKRTNANVAVVLFVFFDCFLCGVPVHVGHAVDAGVNR